MDEAWFQSLDLEVRGLFLQMIIWAKKAGDGGVYSFRSFGHAADTFGTNRRKFQRYLVKLKPFGVIKWSQDGHGAIIIEVTKYRKYQEKKEYSTKLSGQIEPPNGRQTKLNRTKLNQTEVIREEKKSKVKSKKILPAKAGQQKDGSIVWEAYSAAYETRYKVKPVRNAKTNTMCKQLAQRLGVDDASKTASFYVGHGNQWYVTKGHSLQCLLGDCEKIRTEMITGKRITATSARDEDLATSNKDAAKSFIEKQRVAGKDGW